MSSQAPEPPTYYCRLWYSHERGYESSIGKHSLVRRVIDHRRRVHYDLFSNQGLHWYSAYAYESQYEQGEKQDWEFASLSEKQADRITGRWRSHCLKDKGPLTCTYYAEVENTSLENPDEIVREWRGPDGKFGWEEGYTSSVQHGWHWTETWMAYRFKGNGLLVETSEEYAQEVIGRWKARAQHNGRERLYFARLWYALASKPVPEERADWTPLLRRREHPSRDEALLADGSWTTTEALKAWEGAESAYEYIQISEEQARKIAQRWTLRGQLSSFPAEEQQ